MYRFTCEKVITDDTAKKGEVMEAKKSNAAPLRAIRWNESDWTFVGEIAKSIGLSRSAFVKRAALASAAAVSAFGSKYSVDGATATPQNTRPNKLSPINRQSEGGKVGGERSRTRSEPEALSGQLSEKVGREGGVNPTNGARPKATKAKVSRS